MIERDKDTGVQNLSCDECGDMLDRDFYGDDFPGMIDYAKSKGWTIRPDGQGGWEHYCPADKPGGLEDQRRLLSDL